MGVRSALLVGTTSYEDQTLSGLKAPAADVEALAAVLRAPDIGGFAVEMLIDRPSSELMLQIARFFGRRAPDDVLLFYFSGHGVLDDVRELHLAAKNTEREILSASAVSSGFIRGQMERSRAKSQIVLLDCCHGGAFNAGAKGAGLGEIVDAESIFGGGVPGQGRVILTASSATQYAFEGDTLIGQANLSLFTHYIVEGLRTGEADKNGDGQITGDELFEYVNARVQAAAPTQKPTSLIKKEYGEIVVGRSAIIRPSLDLIPPSIVTALKTGSGFERRGAIMSLLDLAKALPPQGVAAARQILQQMVEEDDSVMVRRDAGTALSAIAIPTGSRVSSPTMQPLVAGTWPPAAGTLPPDPETSAAAPASVPPQTGASATAVSGLGDHRTKVRLGSRKLIGSIALGLVVGSVIALVTVVSRKDIAHEQTGNAGQIDASGGVSTDGSETNGHPLAEQLGGSSAAGQAPAPDGEREAKDLYERQALPILGEFAGSIRACLERSHVEFADHKAVLQLTLSETGSVSRVAVGGEEVPVTAEACLKRALRGVPLPAPPKAITTLDYDVPPRISRSTGLSTGSSTGGTDRPPPEEQIAIQAFAAGRYEDALNAFTHLYANTLNPVYLRNIARCDQRLLRPDRAIDEFRDYLAHAKGINAQDRAEVTGYIKEMMELRDRQNQLTVKAPNVKTPSPVTAMPSN